MNSRYSAGAGSLCAIWRFRYWIQTGTSHSIHTEQCPFSQWARKNVQLPKMFALGQIGHMLKILAGKKLQSRSVIIQYMDITDLRRITVRFPDGTFEQCHNSDSYPVHVSLDPDTNEKLALRAFTDKLRIVPATMKTGIPAPISASARRYPDAAHWEDALTWK